jgi:hypothetical protein
MFKFECVGSLNFKNVGDFLTYKITMLEENNKFIEDKSLFEALLIFFCFHFVLFSFFIHSMFFFKKNLCASVIVGGSLITQRCIWVVDGTNSRLEICLCTFLFYNIFMMK